MIWVYKKGSDEVLKEDTALLYPRVQARPEPFFYPSESEIPIKPVRFDELANNIRYEINEYLEDVSMLTSLYYGSEEEEGYTTETPIFTTRPVFASKRIETNETVKPLYESVSVESDGILYNVDIKTMISNNKPNLNIYDWYLREFGDNDINQKYAYMLSYITPDKYEGTVKNLLKKYPDIPINKLISVLMAYGRFANEKVEDASDIEMIYSDMKYFADGVYEDVLALANRIGFNASEETEDKYLYTTPKEVIQASKQRPNKLLDVLTEEVVDELLREGSFDDEAYDDDEIVGNVIDELSDDIYDEIEGIEWEEDEGIDNVDFEDTENMEDEVETDEIEDIEGDEFEDIEDFDEFDETEDIEDELEDIEDEVEDIEKDIYDEIDADIDNSESLESLWKLFFPKGELEQEGEKWKRIGITTPEIAYYLSLRISPEEYSKLSKEEKIRLLRLVREDIEKAREIISDMIKNKTVYGKWLEEEKTTTQNPRETTQGSKEKKIKIEKGKDSKGEVEVIVERRKDGGKAYKIIRKR